MIFYPHYIFKQTQKVVLQLLSVCFLFCSNTLIAQQFSFQNYNTEHGLIQSQPLFITQDKINRLWIGTFGGLSIFDGTNFKNYTKIDGLPDNCITAIDFEANGTAWLGTANGIAKFNGIKYRNLTVHKNQDSNRVNNLKVDQEDNVWVTANNALYTLINDKVDTVTRFANDFILNIYSDKNKNIYCLTAAQGLLKWEQKQWKKIVANTDFWIESVDFSANGAMYLLTNKGLLKIENNIYKWLSAPLQLTNYGNISYKIAVDNNETVWINSVKGSYIWQDKKLTSLNSVNGFTDESTISMFVDNYNNVWLGVNGSGIFKYAITPFVKFDSNILPNAKSISSIGNINGSLLVSSTILGSYILDEKNKKAILYKPKDFPEIVNAITISRNNGIFLSHNLQLQWWLNDKRISAFHQLQTFGTLPIETHDSLYLIANGDLYVLRDNSIHPILTKLSLNNGAALPDGNLVLVDNERILKYDSKSQRITDIKKTPGTTITCIVADERRWFLGTDDRGLLIYDLLQDKLISLNQKNGLSCNYVYNLLIDDEGKLWAGTGCGIDKLSFATNGQFNIRSYGPSDGLIGAESNANASFQDQSGKLWFGTTKGLFQLDREKERKNRITPVVRLDELRLFSKTINPQKFSDSVIPFTTLPYNPIFQHNQNSLSFSYRAICLSAPDKITYKYKLQGIDKEFVETKLTTVNYNQLNPGTYTFIVFASDEDGNWHDNAFTYSFTIEAIFYQTVWFKAIAFTLLLSGVAYVIYRYSRQKELQRQRDLRLREEEQNKVRQRTAQDFHDEIGNKITRINLLTMMAEKKAGENTEVKTVLQQIRQNTQSLYHGSKDIIWALQKESSYLKEALLRIQQNAIAIINETEIKLIIEEEPPIKEEVLMPLDYGRNLTLIFKEAINNAIKYAQANQLILRFYEDIDNSIVLELEDNGIGFDTDIQSNGNGLENMQHRAQAIKGKLTVHSLSGIGTLIRLRLFHYSFEA